MQFTKFVTSTLMLGFALAGVLGVIPGVALDNFETRRDIQARQYYQRNNVVTVVVTEVCTVTVPFLGHRQATSTLPAFLATVVNDYGGDMSLSRNCKDFLVASTIVSSQRFTNAVTFAISATDSDCETISSRPLPTSTKPTSTKSTIYTESSISTSSSASLSSSCQPPYQGCVLSNGIIDYQLVTKASACQTHCLRSTGCVAYQVGNELNLAGTHCNILDASALADQAINAYCNLFFTYKVNCPVIAGRPSASPTHRGVSRYERRS
ncbi:hypothetical protein V501_03676 [Pseudogymnoascus sp. VKM F-4519 (FW-2642)]|nr:hypothetical protein V501_03676 [Pseudogymnoascus sp. VKM F-4519 (FW-2642)]